MTQYLENMKIGDTIFFRGPKGRLFYHGPGITPMLQLIRHITKDPNDRTRMSLIFANQSLQLCGNLHPTTNSIHKTEGLICRSSSRTVVCPGSWQRALQLEWRQLWKECPDQCSQPGEQQDGPGGTFLTEEDILVRKELEEIAKTHPDQFDLWYTLDRPPIDWKYSSGFVTADMIKEHLPPPGKSTLILVCGPPLLIQTAAHPNLEMLGYTRDMIFTY
ncbi:hypothetical protein P7K49_022130 [Saguinus oedipus]|uniref:Oxidoreductase FAD/NAD(P)-binding domain-containing protein n=1 Tax=Saguinus oedipus TaxID=9490 RepID=A0ABQ9UUQ9_SAGOE|nr:hypothetical protein P7K49_022130 [Saguinus oedipus]